MNIKPITALFRSLIKNKLYTCINILGLSIAITVALLIYSFIIKEFQTDRFHKNKENIYRIITKQNNSSPFEATQYGPLAPVLQKQISGIDGYVRIWPNSFTIKTEYTPEFGALTSSCHADTTFFKVFSFPLLSGSVTGNAPLHWAVISEKIAKQYFGNENPVGRTLYIRDYFWFPDSKAYQVIAVMKDIPAWSTIQTELVLDYRDREKQTNWHNNCSTTNYLLIKPNVPISNIEKSMHEVYTDIYPDFEGKIKLQSLQDIYYNKENVRKGYMGPQGSLLFTQMLIGITLLVLFLSSCNYIMIKMVQGQNILKYFAIQRYFGASNYSIKIQCILETTFSFGIAVIIAILLTAGLFPYFQDTISPKYQYPFPLNIQSTLVFLLFLGGYILLISYTLNTIFLHRLNCSGIRNTLHKKNSTIDLRKILAFISIFIFCLLLIDAIIVRKQMHYIKNKDIGCNFENTITIGACSDDLKSTLQNTPNILSVSIGCSPLPCLSPFPFYLSCLFDESGEMNEKVSILNGDADYLKTYQIEIIEGENFDPNTQPVSEGIIPVIVNQTFVKHAGLKQAVGTIFKGSIFPNAPYDSFQIIGIIKDFNFLPLYQPLTPLVYFYSKGSGYEGYIRSDQTSFRYLPGKRGEIISFLTQNNLHITQEYDYSAIYEKEEVLIKLINWTACIAMFIGGLGIFAFSVYFAENRKKEVVIRKINGSTEWELQKLFNKEFIKLTLCACIFSIPLAYYSISSWLQGFAYHVPLKWYFFLSAIIGCLLFVILIITWQIRKIIHIDPVKCLKEE